MGRKLLVVGVEALVQPVVEQAQQDEDRQQGHEAAGHGLVRLPLIDGIGQGLQLFGILQAQVAYAASARQDAGEEHQQEQSPLLPLFAQAAFLGNALQGAVGEVARQLAGGLAADGLSEAFVSAVVCHSFSSFSISTYSFLRRRWSLTFTLLSVCPSMPAISPMLRSSS